MNDTIEACEIIAHRGFSAIAPENTLAAFDLAIEAGADSLELDVRLSGDGIPIVIHDETLQRTTPMRGEVSQTPWRQLRGLDAGSWFDEEFAEERIPTLAEALDATWDLPKFLYLDIKPHPTWTDDRIGKVLRLLGERGRIDRCYVCSFDTTLLERFREQSTEVRLCYLVATVEAFRGCLSRASREKAIVSCLAKVLLDEPGLVRDAKARKTQVLAWVVDDLDEWERLKQIGVRGVVTNTLCDRALEWLED
ncbi:glycerophosphodiester phosphodiesterase [Baaleninema simplex]|uniref:glycerophosphodiester phosphodiesterase n=1 Tax=Baaleninema simplex TaxID=2862350 RepID=UPI000475D1C4|nr:glycerophosphodiester phosphodiesterase family protein [Baaleninema simplex]